MIDVGHLGILWDQIGSVLHCPTSFVESLHGLGANNLSRKTSRDFTAHILKWDRLLRHNYVLVALFVRFLRLRPVVLVLIRLWVQARLPCLFTSFNLARRTVLSFPLVELSLQFGLAFVLTFDCATFLLGFLFHLGQVVLLGFPLGLFIQGRDHLVVVPALSLLCRCLDEVILDDPVELLVPIVDDLGRDRGHVRLVEQEPVGVLALENREIRVEKGSESFKSLIIRHFLLAVVSCVDKMAQDALLDLVGAIVLCLHDDLLDFFICAEAGPKDEFELAEHK